MSEEETVTFNLELNVEQAYSNMRRLELLLYRTIALARRFGLPDNVTEWFYLVQRAVLSIRMLQTSLMMLYTASGPVGWALGIVGLSSAAMTMGDTIEMGMGTH
jgi:hypothetical protein